MFSFEADLRAILILPNGRQLSLLCFRSLVSSAAQLSLLLTTPTFCWQKRSAQVILAWGNLRFSILLTRSSN